MKSATLILYCLLFGFSCICGMCRPEPVDDIREPEPEVALDYDFTQPQHVSVQDFVLARRNGFKQLSCIKEGSYLNAVTSTNTYVDVANNNFVMSLAWQFTKNGVTKRIALEFISPFPTMNSIPCFDTDPTGTLLFVVVNTLLYKCDLTQSVNGNVQAIKVAEAIGEPVALKVVSADELLLTTDLANGSLLKIDQNGNKEVVASNLGAAGVFDIYNNEYYIVARGVTGAIKKVAQDGSISELVTNINAPSNICFDRNGNFILQEKWTNDGANYQRYKLYTPTGTLIEYLGDHVNTLIVSGEPQLFTPLYVDQFNNLYFSHQVTANTSGITNCNPNSSLKGIWKLQMNKR